MSFVPDRGELLPLTYHTKVVDYLRRHEPEVWRWAAERTVRAEQLESLRAELLRDTYRIDAQVHGDVHAALTTAMSRLGIEGGATLYQSPGQDMNASLVFVPGEIHMVLQGPLLERLSSDELLAVFGHELAHHLLWSRDEGQFLVADRILHDTVAAHGPCESHRETYRRYSLHTELFADRGGAIAAGAVEPAVSTLVKVVTGMGVVDAAAYLRQAEEIESAEKSASAAYSHPETFIRARAVALWWAGHADLETWLRKRLIGPLVLDQLDLLDQARLQALSRGFLAHYLADVDCVSETVMTQVRGMFPDWQNDEIPAGPETFASDVMDDSVHRYFNALMMDLALADPDLRDAGLLRAGRIATQLGSFEALQTNLRRDAGFGKRELERYTRQLTDEVRA
ncbi:M48 family metalloprotease [Denitromonas iodatirespirans]|uniref:M48 family metalloprotease n=1 Tax=Denitromonas iodatirespirans TaxID=2795389 RepID=A0A944HF59_DENI1|nr:M48 family metalloprotease [Denitromonas iodatirespirans]MBT0963446.1 M48 family metalloprotease [Denitromonas iodatirespirans]